MKLVTGSSIWSLINKIPAKYTYLSEDENCDICIIGGGITGALCAYYLTEAGIKTILVDRNLLGYGSTRASTSILQYEIDSDLVGLKAMIGLDKAVKAFKLCEKAVFEIDGLTKILRDNCGFRFKDCLYYTYKPNDVGLMQREFELRKSNGFDVEYISESSSAKRFPFLIKGGIYSRRGAGEIDPYRFTHSLINYSSNKGLKVFENTEIVNIAHDAGGVTLSSLNGFTIRASKAIIATGYEGKKYIKEKIVTLSRSFTIATRPIKNFNGWPNQCIIRDNTSNYTYLRTTEDNRVLIGGQDLDTGGDRSAVMNLEDNSHPISIEKYKILTDKLKAMFPEIKDIEFDFGFSGLFGTTKDGLPYVGEYKPMPNCYFCLGYGANGILYSLTGAQLIRDLFLGKPNSAEDIYSFCR